MSPQYLSPGVYVEEVDRGSKPIEGVGTSVAAFIGFTEKGPVNQPMFVTNWTQFMSTFGGFVEGSYLAQAVYGYYLNGGANCYVTRLPDGGASQTAQQPAAQAALPSRSSAALETLTVSALGQGTDGEISVEVASAGEGAPEDQFNLVVRRGETVETFNNVTLAKGRGARNVVETVNKESKLVRVAEKEATGSLVERAPAFGTYTLKLSGVRSLVKQELTPAVFIGQAAERSGVQGLEIADDVTMICVPDLMAAHQAGKIAKDDVKAVQLAVLAHCELMKDRFAILDCPPGLNPQQVKEWRVNEAGYDSKYGAVYYPWLKVADPRGSGTMLVPPSGYMAGIYARSDTERGVHKAPANEVVRGAVGIEMQISKNEQDSLNPVGINCIRAFPGRGIRVWGARTLSSDASWRYINVRRLFNFVEKSIEQGTQWVVFEPNDEDLWRRIRRDVTAFLTRVWRDGALFGSTTDEAFYVKCDRELNPPEVRDAGQVIIEVGIAPVKPAEFVVFRISQYAGVAE